MNIKKLFDVFSRRKSQAEKPKAEQPQAEKPLKRLTPEFRNRVLMLCRDYFGKKGYGQEFWIEMHRRLAYLTGRHLLSNDPELQDDMKDVLKFVIKCGDDHFLDFIEYIFQVECYWRACPDENRMIEEINHFLLIEDLPYALTPFIRETRMEDSFGGPRAASVVVSHPKVVMRDHQVPHSEAIGPAIQLLADKGFTSANLEFLEALEDYRKGKYRDCLTKCGSAFESTMKLLCAKRRWPYAETDTAAPLLKVILAHSTLDPYFEQPLLNIATLRNRLSSSHGGGTTPRSVPPQRARYAINATAAAILLLVEECG